MRQAAAATRRGRRRRLVVGCAVVVAIAVTGVLYSFDLIGGGERRSSTEPPPRELLADPTAGPSEIRVVTKDGHSTHPTWYHDTQLAATDGGIFAVWNGDGRAGAAELRSSDLEIVEKVKLSDAELGGTSDSTGTDRNRHDVPAVVTDGEGSLHFLYGGGTLSGQGQSVDGPFWRRGVQPGSLTRLAPEQALDLGGGSAYDFEAARDARGVQHLIGQRGRESTGSLIELRLAPDGTWLAPRDVIRAGFQPDGCRLNGTPRGCLHFAIARLTADTGRGRLHLVWGWSEASLSGACETDVGFCDHDLFYAYSDDSGASWRSGLGDAQVVVDEGPIAHRDGRFRVAGGHIGVFKAVAAGRGGPLVIFTARERDGMGLYALQLRGGRWRRTQLARAGDYGVRSWEGSLVLRSDDGVFTLWTPTGERIVRFSSADDGESWRATRAYRGDAWSLTGVPDPTSGDQLLLWRGDVDGKEGRQVVLGRFPLGDPTTDPP